jgi:TctA family transporter
MVVWLQLCICVAFAAAANLLAFPFLSQSGPADFASFILMIVAFAVLAARGHAIKALAMATLGLLLSCVGSDMETAELRLTGGFRQFVDGINVDIFFLGLFIVSVLIRSMDMKLVPDRLLPLVTRIPENLRRLSIPLLIILSNIYVYCFNYEVFDVILLAVVGLLGYLAMKQGFDIIPLFFAFALGKLMEEKLRQAMLISRGSLWVFVERPLSAGFLIIAVLLLVFALLPSIRSKRDEVFTE